MPEVSVIMPVYNAVPFLREAMESILKQTFVDWELIVVEDCSTDASKSIIAAYSDSRIRPVYREKNGGVVAAMNDGIRASKGKYIAVMHADDISHPQRLEREVSWLKDHPGHVLVAGFIDQIDEQGNNCGEWDLDRRMVEPGEIRRHMLIENCIAHSSVLMRADVLRRYGYDDGQQKKGFAVEDYGLWLELLSDGYEFAKIPEVLLYYRVHRQSATSQYLRRNNPFFINHETKKRYLERIARKRKFNSFDRSLRQRMYIDYLLARGKELKQKFIRQ